MKPKSDETDEACLAPTKTRAGPPALHLKTMGWKPVLQEGTACCAPMNTDGSRQFGYTGMSGCNMRFWNRAAVIIGIGLGVLAGGCARHVADKVAEEKGVREEGTRHEAPGTREEEKGADPFFLLGDEVPGFFNSRQELAGEPFECKM
jgi:hypothetical protein